MNSYRIPTVHPGQKAARGFTLAELLIAVTLLSIVMSSVYSLTHSALGTWRSVERGYDMHLEARSFLTLFSHEYSNMVGRASHLFEGDNNTIVMFIIAQPLDLDEGEGPRLMRVEYSYNRSKRSIEREEALVEAALPMPDPSGEPIDSGRIKLKRRHKTTVADNVSRFKIQYVWAPLPEHVAPTEPPVPEPLVFLDSYNEELGLPQAIEISMMFSDPDDSEQTYYLQNMLPMRAPSSRIPRQLVEDL